MSQVIAFPRSPDKSPMGVVPELLLDSVNLSLKVNFLLSKISYVRGISIILLAVVASKKFQFGPFPKVLILT